MPKKSLPSDAAQCYRVDEGKYFVCFGKLFGLESMEVIYFDSPKGQEMLKEWDNYPSTKHEQEVNS